MESREIKISNRRVVQPVKKDVQDCLRCSGQSAFHWILFLLMQSRILLRITGISFSIHDWGSTFDDLTLEVDIYAANSVPASKRRSCHFSPPLRCTVWMCLNAKHHYFSAQQITQNSATRMIVFGGCSDQGKWLSDLYTLDLASWRWDKQATEGLVSFDCHLHEQAKYSGGNYWDCNT